MKSISYLLIATSIFSSLAFAGEESWPSMTVTLPSMQNQLSGYRTDAGNFRLERAENTKGTIYLSGNSLNRNLEKAKTVCQLQGPSLKQSKNYSKNSFKIESFAYPIAEAELKKAAVQIENKPNLYNLEVHLSTSDKSFTTAESAQKFQALAEAKIKDQMESLRSTGQFSIELPQIDDVACDLILGTAQLSIHFGLSQIPAKHRRESVMSSQELARVYESLKKVSFRAKDPLQRKILSAALLSATLQKELGHSVSEMGEAKFLSIYQGLFSPETGNLRVLADSQYESVAQSMDLLSQDVVMLLLKTDLTVQLGELP